MWSSSSTLFRRYFMFLVFQFTSFRSSGKLSETTIIKKNLLQDIFRIFAPKTHFEHSWIWYPSNLQNLLRILKTLFLILFDFLNHLMKQGKLIYVYVHDTQNFSTNSNIYQHWSSFVSLMASIYWAAVLIF